MENSTNGNNTSKFILSFKGPFRELLSPKSIPLEMQYCTASKVSMRI
jgi:hypothetical protein